ncbi:MAG: hypothetical protein HYY00_09250 [Chloroflexi bacterium]|nr:hypothetical protein [Chloroflexota bacterium]
MKPATVRRSASITWASLLFLLMGGFYVAGIVPMLLYIIRNRELPPMLGFRALEGPISQGLGIDAVIVSLYLLAVVSAAEVVAGYWLWKSRKLGGVAALAISPVSRAFWIGYEVPPFILVVVVRAILVWRGWRSLRG